ncbi:MAG: methyl-accepting chemotaxis protein [Nitriliruptoraceae bacterium]
MDTITQPQHRELTSAGRQIIGTASAPGLAPEATIAYRSAPGGPQRRWRDLSVRTRLHAVLLSISAGVLLMSGVAFVQLSGLLDAVGALEQDVIDPLEQLPWLVASANEQHRALSVAALDPDASLAELERTVTSTGEDVAERLASLQAVNLDTAGRDALDAVFDAWSAYDAGVVATLTALADGSSAQATEELRRADEVGYRELTAALATLNDQLIDRSDRESGAAIVRVTAIRVLLVGASVLLSLAAVVAALRLSRAITRPLREAVQVLEQVRDGDLTARVEVASSDEFGQLGTALNETTAQLGSTLEVIADNANTLAAAAEELTVIGTQLHGTATTTTDQATSVASATEQVSQSMATIASASEEMGAAVDEIARSASEATGVAERGVGVTATAGETMSKLQVSSTEIGEIVTLINEIAGQTHLLALNASIEAARAGQAGRAFAVVADEVGQLARRTAKATDDITTRIEVIQTDADASVEALRAVTETIGEISQLQTVIATSVEEQASTTSEIARNVTEVAEATGSISETIQEVSEGSSQTRQAAGTTAESAESLAELAEQLRTALVRFRY